MGWHFESIGDHVGLTHKPRGESHYRSRTESQIERSLRRSGRCLTWLWSASLSCSAGPAPCTRDESVSARFAVGVGCTAAGASGWPTLAPSLEPDPASPCDCGWSCKLGLSKGGVFSEHIFAAHLRIPRPQGRVSSVRAAAVQAQWSPTPPRVLSLKYVKKAKRCPRPVCLCVQLFLKKLIATGVGRQPRKGQEVWRVS